jgi:hypothetical protein
MGYERQGRLDYADLVRRVVRRLRREPPPSLPSDRRRLVGAIEQALHARARRRLRLRRGAGLSFAAAAMIALAFGGARLWRGAARGGDVATVASNRAVRALTVLGADDGQAVAVGGDKRIPLRNGMAVGAGLQLRAPTSGEVRVGTAEGTLLTLEPRGELTVAEAGATQRFALRTGAMRAHVARLFAGERFIVDTADAEIEVHGTMFRVATAVSDPRCGDGTTTRVSVTEGVVTVRAGGRQTLVPAGGQWPTGCDVPAERAERLGRRSTVAARHARHRAEPPSDHPEPWPSVQVVAPVVVAATKPSAANPATTPTMNPSASSSDLAAQNDLFAAAVRAKKEGQLADAARLFGKLVGEHPASPLLESATVQRMKVLAAIDPAVGARAAADYLARFPGGFARPEAETLATRLRQ